MKHCQNCGAKMNDDAIFCLSCGAAAPEAATMEAVEQSQMPAAKNSNKLIFIILGVVAVAILAVVLLVVVPMLKSDREAKETSLDAESVAKNYVAFLNSGDYTKLADLIIPQPIMDYYETTYQANPREIFTEQSMGFFTQYAKKYGDGWTATYKIQSVENMPENDLKAFKKTYKNLYNMEITDVRNLKYKVFFDKDQKKSESVAQTVYEYNGKWYIYYSLP